MARYKIWDKESDIYTLGPIPELEGKRRATAQEYIEHVIPWAAHPDTKVIVTEGIINGKAIMEFGSAVGYYKTLGARITDDMADVEVLAAIEAFEDARPEVLPDAAERQAAALEFLAMMSM